MKERFVWGEYFIFISYDIAWNHQNNMTYRWSLQHVSFLEMCAKYLVFETLSICRFDECKKIGVALFFELLLDLKHEWEMSRNLPTSFSVWMVKDVTQCKPKTPRLSLWDIYICWRRMVLWKYWSFISIWGLSFCSLSGFPIVHFSVECSVPEIY